MALAPKCLTTDMNEGLTTNHQGSVVPSRLNALLVPISPYSNVPISQGVTTSQPQSSHPLQVNLGSLPPIRPTFPPTPPFLFSPQPYWSKSACAQPGLWPLTMLPTGHHTLSSLFSVLVSHVWLHTHHPALIPSWSSFLECQFINIRNLQQPAWPGTG